MRYYLILFFFYLNLIKNYKSLYLIFIIYKIVYFKFFINFKI